MMFFRRRPYQRLSNRIRRSWRSYTTRFIIMLCILIVVKLDNFKVGIIRDRETILNKKQKSETSMGSNEEESRNKFITQTDISKINSKTVNQNYRVKSNKDLTKEVSTNYFNKTEGLLPPTKKELIVHIDVKGAPPKLHYLLDLLGTLQAAGATGILLEYDDMFCYDGNMLVTSSLHCYEHEEVRRLLRRARDLDLTVIPLVQTFGHMESVLRVSQLLSESLESLSVICPTKYESIALVADRLYQVLMLHRSVAPVRRVHIGGDAVYYLNECDDCRERNLSSELIYLDHLSTVIDFVKLNFNETQVLFWADKLRNIAIGMFSQVQIPASVIPVLSDGDPSFNVTQVLNYEYLKLFNEVWVASSYKAVDAPISNTPNVLNRYKNTKLWMEFINKYTAKEGTKGSVGGLILRGQAKLSYMLPVCDPLPGALPALLLCLATAQALGWPQLPAPQELQELQEPQEPLLYRQHVAPRLARLLRCARPPDLYTNDTATLFDGCAINETDFRTLNNNDILMKTRQTILSKYFRAHGVATLLEEFFD